MTPRLHFKFEPGQVAGDTYTAVDTKTNSLISAVIVSSDYFEQAQNMFKKVEQITHVNLLYYRGIIFQDGNHYLTMDCIHKSLG